MSQNCTKEKILNKEQFIIKKKILNKALFIAKWAPSASALLNSNLNSRYS